jgi:hypothetical protein
MKTIANWLRALANKMDPPSVATAGGGGHGEE